nr:reverse transcriptase domain-containing protein [Tanacetum cinerariifolium]
MKHSYSNDDTCFSIDVIDEILEEDFDALFDEGSIILHSIKGTLLEKEIFFKFDEFMAMTADENSESESDTEEPLCNSPVAFQRCMLGIIHDMIKEFVKEKCHFMVKEGIVLGHKVSDAGLKVDKAVRVIISITYMIIGNTKKKIDEDEEEF